MVISTWTVYGIITAIFVALYLWNIRANSDNDIASGFVGLIITFFLLLFNAIWGGIFWW